MVHGGNTDRQNEARLDECRRPTSKGAGLIRRAPAKRGQNRFESALEISRKRRLPLKTEPTAGHRATPRKHSRQRFVR